MMVLDPMHDNETFHEQLPNNNSMKGEISIILSLCDMKDVILKRVIGALRESGVEVKEGFDCWPENTGQESRVANQA